MRAKSRKTIRRGPGRQNRGNDEKVPRDMWAGCVVKRLLRDTKEGGRKMESDVNHLGDGKRTL